MTKKPAIFLFLTQMSAGGQERFVSRLSAMLHEQYDLYIVLLDNTKINYPVSGTVLCIHGTGFTRHSLYANIKKMAVRCTRLRRLIKQYRPIACMSFGSGPDLVNLICRRKGTKVFPSIRGYATAERIIQKRWMRALYARADQVICVSRGIEDKLRRGIPALAGKTTVLYNAYDCEQIATAAKMEIPDSLRSAGEPRLVSVGTLRPEKGYWHLIKAVSVLKRDYPNILLSIVGPDYLDNGANLKKLAERLGLEGNVRFEGWHSNPYAFTENSDIYVLSSVREGFPNALVEAMACGKPVVAADCLTGPREILSELPWDTAASEIEQAEYGVLVPRLDTREDYTENISPEEETLAEAIRLLLESPALREEYGKRAAKRAAEFSYQACAEHVTRILEGSPE